MRNPYFQMRMDARRSQSDLCKSADITDQYVRKLEHGLITTPDLRVAREIFDDLPTGYTNKIIGVLHANMDVVDSKEFEDICVSLGARPTMDKKLELFALYYKTWQRYVRSILRDALSLSGFASPPVGTSPSDIRFWIMSYVAPDEATEEFYSVRNFCTLISLHPSTWERWEKGYPKVKISPTVRVILHEIGVDVG